MSFPNGRIDMVQKLVKIEKEDEATPGEPFAKIDVKEEAFNSNESLNEMEPTAIVDEIPSNFSIKVENSVVECVFKCAKCAFISESRWSVKNHLFYNHSPKFKQNKTYTWGATYQSVTEKMFNSVSNQSKDGLFKCEKCPFHSTFKPLLDSHVLHRHTAPKFAEISKIEMYKCLKCPFKTKEKFGIKIHINNRHPENAHSRIIPAPTSVDCDKHNFMEKNTRRLRPHVNEKHTRNTTGGNFPMNHWRQCIRCPFKTRTQESLEDHVLKYHPRKTHVCLHCEYKTNNPDDLSIHMMRHMSFVYKCPFCEFKSRLLRDIRTHYNVCHQSQSAPVKQKLHSETVFNN